MALRKNRLHRLVASYVVSDPQFDFDVACARGQWIAAKWLDDLHGIAANLDRDLSIPAAFVDSRRGVDLHDGIIATVFSGTNFAAMLWMASRQGLLRCIQRVHGLPKRTIKWAVRHLGGMPIQWASVFLRCDFDVLHWLLNRGELDETRIRMVINQFGPSDVLRTIIILEWCLKYMPHAIPIHNYRITRSLMDCIRRGNLCYAKRLANLLSDKRPLNFVIDVRPAAPGPVGARYYGNFHASTPRCMQWAYTTFGIDPPVMRGLAAKSQHVPTMINKWAVATLAKIEGHA